MSREYVRAILEREGYLLDGDTFEMVDDPAVEAWAVRVDPAEADSKPFELLVTGASNVVGQGVEDVVFTCWPPKSNLGGFLADHMRRARLSTGDCERTVYDAGRGPRGYESFRWQVVEEDGTDDGRVVAMFRQESEAAAFCRLTSRGRI